MIKGGTGGANTTTGLDFEAKTDIRALFESIEGYHLVPTSDRAGYEVWFNGKLLAHCFRKLEFYRFLARELTRLTGGRIYPNGWCRIMAYL